MCVNRFRKSAWPNASFVECPNDETYQRALKAGALVTEEPADVPHGDRRATVHDPWGNIWQIATHRCAFT
jgi:uncharacterized glyoxalase superfamily protein PhnB